MKKIILLFLLEILVTSQVAAIAELEEHKEIIISEIVNFSQPIIVDKEEFVSIELKETNCNTTRENKPMIPMVTKIYTFPLGTLIKDVKVSFSRPTEKKIEKLIKVSPEINIYMSGYVAKNDIKQNNLINYSDIDIYPESKFDYRVAAGLMDEERVIFLTVTLKPVQYIPRENLILFSKNAKVDISYYLPESPVNFPNEYDFLIITPSQFESALQLLVDHKNNLNPPVRTKMITLDDIPSGVGVDTQEDIKLYIKEAIENWNITYILLVGAGLEGKEIFPVRNIWIPDQPYEDFFPSDLYYADIYNSDMEFSDWDADNNGKYGEYPNDLPEMDILPDVYIGKLPCNSIEEVNTIVDKIINYKAHNKMIMKILQIAGDCGPVPDINEGEYANEKVMEKLPGYTPIRLWASNGKLTKWNIRKEFNRGVDFVVFSGHGNPTSWVTFSTDHSRVKIPSKTIISPYDGFFNFDIDLYDLKNFKKLPVVIFIACSNNKYTESQNCLGWKMLSKTNGGSIASFGATGIVGAFGGKAFVEGFIGWMEVKVFEELYITKVLGNVWANCINQYYSNFELVFNRRDYKTMLEFSMFGDPTLIINDGDDPIIRTSINNSFLMKFLEQYPIFQRMLSVLYKYYSL